MLRGLNTGSADLIYLDPPFNSGKQWSAPVGSAAAGASFRDAWTLSDVDAAWHGEIADRHPPLYAIIDAAGLAHGKPMKSYLIYMGVRLMEMKRVLAPAGSIYLHCDDTAGAYLRTAMDAVFGADSFRNEITWKRTSSRSDARRYGRISDRILYTTPAAARRGTARGSRSIPDTSPGSTATTTATGAAPMREATSRARIRART